MLKKFILIIVFLCLFPGLNKIYSQNKNTSSQEKRYEQKIRFLLKKLEKHERKFQEYEHQITNLREEIKNIKEQLEDGSEEREEKFQDFREEIDVLFEETHGEVIEERTMGLLSRYFGNNFIHISGYYRFEYLQDNQDNSPGHFRVHEVTLFFRKKIHDFNFFLELEFEDAVNIEGTGDDIEGAGKIKVEQVWAEYIFHPLLNIRAGLILTPETSNLSHYPTTTYSTLAPLHLARIFPREYAGISFYGDTTNLIEDDFGIGYQFYIANGDGPNHGKEDINENKSIGAMLTLHLPKFDIFETIDIKGNLYFGKDRDNNHDFLWNIELLLDIKKFSLYFEYAQGRRDFSDATEALQKKYGGFLEIAYAVQNQYTIFQRLEILDQDQRNKERVKRAIWGVRYQPWPEVSLKGEFFREWHEQEQDFYGIALSLVLLL